jgi:hypothetical protein
MPLRRESLLLLGLITALCTLTSVVAGIATGGLVRPDLPAPTFTPIASTPVPTPAPPTISPPVVSALATTAPATAGSQRSLLLIGVDALDAAVPRLEGCWVVTYRPGLPEYYVLGFPPSAQFSLPSLSGTRTLEDVFVEDLHQQRGFQFMHDAINTRFPGIVIEADLLLDRTDLVNLITRLGGLQMSSQALTGADVLLRYDSLQADDMTSRMSFQNEVFGSLYALLGQQQWTPLMVFAYLQQLPQVTDNPEVLAALTVFAATAPPFTGPQPIWRTYDPSLEIVAQP